MNREKPTRREWLKATAGVAAAATIGTRLQRAVADARSAGLRIGMCDWNLGRQDPSAFELAKRIGLDGVEISFATRGQDPWMRRPAMQKQYREAARKQGLAIPSMAMGVLNQVPLMSEPRAALWVADAIEVAQTLSIPTILLAFFTKGHLKEENAKDMQRVTEALVELAPRAEKAGVILGIESYLSAEGHLKIIDAVKSKHLQVYYDLYNSATAGHDVLKEIRMLGRERICQVHFKDKLSLEQGSGSVDWPAAVAALKEIKYPGWIVLETQSPNDVVSDTKKNMAYVRQLFGEKRCGTS